MRYVTTEIFMNEFVEAIRTNSRPDFKRRYRDVDLLLVDDVQFMQNHERLQEEFFHTFDSLHGSGSQLVLSSDRPPKAMATLEDRLRTRFEWGLQTDIQPPEYETRLAILRHKARAQGFNDTPDEVLSFIATHITDNVRELEGALIRVAAYASLTRIPATEDLAREVLADDLRTKSLPGDHPAGDPRGDGQDVQLDDRGPVRSEPPPAPGDRPPDRHVRLPGVDGLQLPPDRPGVRRP